jgi:cation diffusion facilitator CzcD-associated flavoprotein CzcO
VICEYTIFFWICFDYTQYQLFCHRPGIFYCFSFAPKHAWATVLPSGKEILQYLQGVCEKFHIADKIQLDTEVLAARWLEEEELWEVTIARLAPRSGDLSARDRKRKIETGEQDIILKRETIRCKILISAVGGLVEPNALPCGVPGWEAFEGNVFHSARWDHNVNFTDKDVVVVGTGCSATQFVPRLTKAPYNAKSVIQLMRSPPWLVPALKPPFGHKIWEAWSPIVFTYVPAIGWLFRQVVATASEYDWRLFGGSEYSKREREKVRDNLKTHCVRLAYWRSYKRSF